MAFLWQKSARGEIGAKANRRRVMFRLEWIMHARVSAALFRRES